MANREIIVEKIAHLQEIDVVSDLAVNAPGTVTFSNNVLVDNLLSAVNLLASGYVQTSSVQSAPGQPLVVTAQTELDLVANAGPVHIATAGAGQNIILSPGSGAQVVLDVAGIDMQNHGIVNLPTITSSGDLTLTPASGNLLVAASVEPTADNTYELGSGGLQWSAVNTYQVSNTQSGSNLVLSTAAGGNISLQAATNVIDANSARIVNVATPTSSSDAVNKLYADSISAGLDPKTAVLVATNGSLLVYSGLPIAYNVTPSNGQFTGVPLTTDYLFFSTSNTGFVNGDVYTDGTYSFTVSSPTSGTGQWFTATGAHAPVNPSGTLTRTSGTGPATVPYGSYTLGFQIDGVTLTSGARILVKDQTDAKQNGIYFYDGVAGTITRAPDMDGSVPGDVAGGDYTFVQAGTTWAGYGFNVIWPGSITLNVDPVNWSQFSGGSNLANRDLSNLIPTAINQDLNPGLDNTQQLGNSGAHWTQLFLSQALVGADNGTVIDTNSRQLINNGGAAVVLDFGNTNLITHTDFVPDINGARSIGAFGNAFANIYAEAFYSSALPAVFGSGSVDGSPGAAGYGVQVFADGAGLQANVNGGAVQIQTANATGTGVSGGISLLPGSAVNGNVGTILLQTPVSTGTGNGGDVILQTLIPTGSGTRGRIILDALSIDASNTNIINVADPVNPQDAATKAYVDSGATNANRYLSNLLAPTAINQQLNPNGAFAQNIGDGTTPWGSVATEIINLFTAGPTQLGNLGTVGTLPTGGGVAVYLSDAGNHGDVGLFTNTQAGQVSGSIPIQTGYTTGGFQSGAVVVRTGDAAGAASGNVSISSGGSDTIVGDIFIYNGINSAGAAGGISLDATGLGDPGLTANPGQIGLYAASVLQKTSGASADQVLLEAGNVTGTGTLGTNANRWSSIYGNLLDLDNGQGSVIKINGGTGAAYLSSVNGQAMFSAQVSLDTSGSWIAQGTSAASLELAPTPATGITFYYDTGLTTGVAFSPTPRWTLNPDGSVQMTQILNMQSNQIINVTDPTAASDAATKNYVDTAISTGGANVHLSNLVAPTAINADLLPAASYNLGTSGAPWNVISGSNVLTGNLYGPAGDNTVSIAVGSDLIFQSLAVSHNISTAQVGGLNASDALNITTGMTMDGNSGQINIFAGGQVPLGAGSQGAVVLGNGGTGAILVQTAGNFEVTAAASYFTGSIYTSADITYNIGSTTERFNQVFFNTMVDAAGVNEIDLTNRYLVDGSGVNAIQWGAGNRYLIDSGSAAVFDWDASANGGSILINANLLPTINATYNLGSASAQFANIFADVIESTTGLTLYAPSTQIVLQGSDVNVSSTNIINVLDPVNPQDAATKNYVDSTSASGGLWSKYTIDFSTIAAAGPAVNNVSVNIFNLVPKGVIESVIVVPTTAFVSGAANVIVSVGNSTDNQKYATNYTVSGVVPGGSEFQDFTTSYSLENLTSPTGILLYASVDSGVLGNLTAGSVDVYVKTSQLP